MKQKQYNLPHYKPSQATSNDSSVMHTIEKLFLSLRNKPTAIRLSQRCLLGPPTCVHPLVFKGIESIQHGHVEEAENPPYTWDQAHHYGLQETHMWGDIKRMCRGYCTILSCRATYTVVPVHKDRENQLHFPVRVECIVHPHCTALYVDLANSQAESAAIQFR